MDTNENPAATAEVPNLPQVPPAPQAAPDVQAPPPATHLVIHGTKTEREIELERRLDETERANRDREMRIAELEDQNSQLKKIPTAAPAPKREKKFGPIPIFYAAGDDHQNPALN